MNNDKLSEFINAIGMMTEIWSVTYRGFKKQGLNDSEALMHTTGLMKALIDTTMKNDTIGGDGN